MENLFNKMFPLKCIQCGDIGEIICDNCLYNSEILSTQFCIVCDKPSFNGFTHLKCFKKNTHVPIQNISVYKYQEIVRDIIKTSKYGSKKFIVLKKLTYEAIKLLIEWDFKFKDYICISIPSSKNKYKSRGFNQVEIITDIIANQLNLTKDDSILTREVDTKAQFTLKKEDRRKNLINAFKVNKDVKNKNILLIDDVITTGSTLKEVSKELYKSGAKRVKCLTLSKKMRHY